jgi:hypothetical protein
LGSGGIRVLHADDGNKGWDGFAGAGNPSSVRNLDVDKVGVADSLTGAVVMAIMVVERIKRSRREEVDEVSSNLLSIKVVNLKKGSHTAVTNRKRSGRTLPPPSLDPGLQPTVTRLDSTNTFINGTVTLSPLLVHSVGQK